MTICDICKFFDIGGQFLSCTELSTGNINSTYHARYFRDGERKDYIVQQINTNVFTNPAKLMENIINVTHYIRSNIKKQHLSTKKFVLRVFLAKDTKKPYIMDDKGNYWRVYRYIKDSVTYDTSDDMRIIENAGQAFGRFQNCLDGYDANSLYVTIPDFHNAEKRYDALHKAVQENIAGRLDSVKPEIEKLFELEEKATELQRLLDSGKIPLRVTHNDTKFNNVAFDKNTGEALAVLDLDTVMPGAIAYDFGDAIRFITNKTIEDSPEVDLVGVDLDKYRAFSKGFLGEVGEKLTDMEKETLVLGVFTMTTTLAVRFMTDYLNGDVYFKVKRQGHNLDRARNQLALAVDVLEKYEFLNEITKEYL